MRRQWSLNWNGHFFAIMVDFSSLFMNIASQNIISLGLGYSDLDVLLLRVLIISSVTYNVKQPKQAEVPPSTI